MIDDKLSPLPDDIASLLGDVKGAPPPPAAARDRVSQRLSASLGISMIGAGVAADLIAEGASELLSEAAAQSAGAAVATSAGAKAGVGAVGAVAAKGAAGAATTAAATTAAATTAAATTAAATTAAATTAAATTAGAATAAASATSAAGTAGLFALFAKPALIGTFVAGTMVGGTTVAVVEPEIISAAPKVVYVAKDDPRLEHPAPKATVAAIPEAEAEAEAKADQAEARLRAKSVRAKRADRRPASTRPAASSNDDDKSLARERALIEIARTALSRGQPGAALNSLKSHERRYPKGRLVEEREGLRVLALVGQGKKREAQRRAKAFSKRYPRSLLNSAIDNALQR